MAKLHTDLSKLRQETSVAEYNTKFAAIITEMGGIGIPGTPMSGNQIGQMQAVTNYKKGLKSPIQRALVAQNFTDLPTLQQAALDVEHNLSTLAVNSTRETNEGPMTCSRCGASNHRRSNCTAKVHCTHCNVGEGHNTKVCFKKFPHLKKHFDKPTNSTASSPARSLPPIQTILQPARVQPPRRSGASAFAIQQQPQQYQTVSNTSNQPIPAAPSSNYCHYHNVWTHGDTNCSLQQQVHRAATVPSAPIHNSAPKTNKPRVPIAQVECYNCHQKGHYRGQCTLPIQTVACAFHDKGIAHKPTICTHVSNWKNFHLPPEQDWTELQFIIDTGSDINLVNSALVYAMGLRDSIQPPTTPVSQLDGQELEIIGKILLPISLGSPPLINTQQWFDVNNFGLNILGTPFLSDTRSVPDIANKKFFVNNFQHSIPLHIEPWSKNEVVFDDDQLTSVEPTPTVNLIVVPTINPPKAPTEPPIFYPVSNGTSHETTDDKTIRLTNPALSANHQTPPEPVVPIQTTETVCLMSQAIPTNLPPAPVTSST